MQAFAHHVFKGIGDERVYSADRGGQHASTYKETIGCMRGFISKYLNLVVPTAALIQRMRYHKSDKFQPKMDFGKPRGIL